MPTTKNKEPTAWEIAKPKLREDILNNIVTPGMGASQVWASRALYQKVPYENFRTNLNTLRKKLSIDQERVDMDMADMLHDRSIHPVNSNPPNFLYPRWDGSDAQGRLEKHVQDKNGMIAGQQKPRHLHATEVDYQAFPVKVFQKHVHQEISSHRESNYWLAKRSGRARNVAPSTVDDNGLTTNTEEQEL
jgi:hypothetical protein